MDAVALLAELRALANNVPDFETYSPASRPHAEWLGKTSALLRLWNEYEAVDFNRAANFLGFHITRDSSVTTLLNLLYRAIAELELQVPTLPRQAFGPGAVYDFLKSLRELLASATNEIFIVDPYLDEQIFDSYLSAISRQVSVRLLAREHAVALKPSVQKFASQTSAAVEVRVSKSIHDRVVFLDGRSCWVLGQSIKDAAKSTPTYLAPLSDDAAQLKKDDYERIWTTATAI